MVITDAQVHVWEKNTPERPWPEGRKHYAHGPEYMSEQLLTDMAEAGVQRAILIPASFAGDDNEVCLDASRAHPDRFAVVGRIEADERTGRATLETWESESGLLGFRMSFSQGFARAWMEDGTVDWLWTAAEEQGIPLMLNVAGSVEYAERLVRKHPDLRLTIDHLGARSSMRGDDLDSVVDRLVTLGSMPNVSVKATCLPLMALDEYPYRSLHDKVSRVIEAFGPKRVFWGSDVTRLPCTYRQCVTMFTEELKFLTREDLAWVMGRGVEEWLGWEPV